MPRGNEQFLRSVESYGRLTFLVPTSSGGQSLSSLTQASGNTSIYSLILVLDPRKTYAKNAIVYGELTFKSAFPTYLDLGLDQLGIHLAIVYARSDANKDLPLLLRFEVSNSLRFGLYFDAFHDERVKVEHCRLHHRLVRLEDENDGDRTFSEYFGRMQCP